MRTIPLGQKNTRSAIALKRSAIAASVLVLLAVFLGAPSALHAQAAAPAPTLADRDRAAFARNSATASAPALSLTKDDGGATVAPGGTVAYTLSYANNGPTAAIGTVLSETIPANTTFNMTGSTLGWDCPTPTTSGSNCTLNVGTLAGGGTSGSATFAVTVDNPVAAGVTQLSNTATISATNSSPVAASDTTPVTASPQLTLSKSDGGATTAPGGTVSYTLTYANTGNQNAAGVALQETVPSNTTFNAAGSDAGWSCADNAPAGTVCTLSIGSLNGGGTGASVQFVVNVNSPLNDAVTQISNSATLSASNASSDNASDTTPVIFPPKLTLTKGDGGASAVPGGVIEYTLSYGNSGDEAATGVTIQETVPANTVFEGPAGQWSCVPNAPSGSTCTHTVGTLGSGASGSVAFRVRVNNPVAAGVTQISNSASISATNAASVNASDTTPVTAAPQLALSKSDGNITATPGSVIIYTLSYSNAGNQNVTGVTLQETVPANTTFESGSSTAGWSCTPNASAGASCTFAAGNVAGGGGGSSATFAVRLNSSVPAGFSAVQNTATFSAPGASSVQASDSTPVNATASLMLTKSAAITTVNPGGTLNYTLAYANTGGREAAAVVLTETVPQHATFQGPAGWSCVPDAAAGATCSFSVGNLAGGGSGSASFTVRITDTVAAAVKTTSNSATIGAANASSATSNVVDTAIGGTPQLDIDIDDILPAVAAGGIISYTVDYSNRGPREALDVLLEMEIPDNTTFSAAQSSAGWNCTTDSCTLSVGSLVGQSDESRVMFAVRAADSLPVGLQKIDAEASISASNATQIDKDTESTYIKALLTTKADELLDDADNSGAPSPGDTLRYQVSIANGGGQTLTDVLFRDTPDSNSTLVAGSVTTSVGTVLVGNTSGDTKVEVDLGQISNNTTVFITFDVKIKDVIPVGVEQISNQGVVLSSQLPDTLTDDPGTQQENDATITSISAQPVLQATKRDVLVNDADDNGFPSTGDTIEYQIEIVNSGNQSALDVVFDDVPDGNTSLVENSVTTDLGTVTSGNDGGDSAVAIDIGQLDPTANATITFRVRIDELLPGVRSIRNQGTVTRSGNSGGPSVQIKTDDPDTIVQEDATVTQLSVNPVLYASKTAVLAEDADDDGLPGPGDTLRYQVVIVNSGNLPATGVTFDDTLDENTTLLTGSVNTSAGIVTSGNTVGDATVSVAVGVLAGQGSSVTISYEARINVSLTAGTTSVQNQGVVTSNELPAVPTDDPNTAEAEDPTVTPLVADPLLTASQTDSLLNDADGDGVPSPGDTILLDVTIRNIGNAAATGVAFRNPVDSNAQLVADSVQTNQGAVVTGNSPSDSVVEVALGSVPGGSRISISFQIVIDDPLDDNVLFIESQGTISSSELDDVLTDDPDIIGAADATVINLSAGPLLQVVKTDLLFIDPDGNGMASAGDTLFYRITLVNNGNAAATDIVVEDTPDAYTTLVVPESGGSDTVQTSEGEVVEGNSADDTHVVVKVDALAGNGRSLTISLRVTVNETIPVDVLINQAVVTHTDFNAAGGQATIMSDDPDTPEKGDATRTPVVRNADLFGGRIFLPFTAQ